MPVTYMVEDLITYEDYNVSHWTEGRDVLARTAIKLAMASGKQITMRTVIVTPKEKA